MAQGYTVSREQVHRYLWSISNSRNRVQVYQKELAEKLQITQATMSYVMRDLAAEGRLKKVAAKANNVGVYVITDPAEYPHPFVPEDGESVCGECGENADHEIHS